jgi:uncharacterized protein YukE
MSNEIKMVFAEVEQELTELKSSAQAVETTFPAAVGGDNVLDVVLKLNDITKSLQTTITSYKTLLLNNEDSTRQSIQAMKQADQEVATTIKHQ